LLAFPLDDTYEIIEVDAPKPFVGKKLGEINLPASGDMYVVTILRQEEKTNFWQNNRFEKKRSAW
jgi:Trk K+ transport system NAD-binding subunit